MSVARVLVMRHGQSEANVAGEIVSDPARGVAGFGLTSAGRAQVRAAVAARPSLAQVTAIHSSDFLRARETAELVRELLGGEVPVALEPGLRERGFGAYEGLEARHYEEVWRRDREVPEAPGEGVEPVGQVLARARAVVGRLGVEHPGGTVLLVCHGDVAQILLAAGEGRPPHEHREVPHLETAGIRELGA